MTASVTEKLRAFISQERWEQALDVLRPLDAADAARLLMAIPFEEQQTLFRRVPVDFAAGLVPALPYYHTYVLLHSRPGEEMSAIVDRMNPAERLQFFDELPEEAWQRLMDELSGQQPAEGVAEAVEHAAPPAEAIIQARRVEKRFERPDGGEVQVIAPTDLAVEPSAIIALLGPSGSGKSTLLRILTGLTPPSSGEVLWHGKPLSETTPNAAIVFQSFALFPWLTVLDNVEVPLLARGVEQDQRRERAMRTLASVGLEGFETAYPKDLSGGMKQRVGFARALAVEPEILFMDVPFSALDVLTAENLRSELMELWLGKKIPTRSVFIVTHNIEEAVLLADRVIVLGRNPARIRADFHIPLKQYRDRHSAEFLLYVDYIYKLMTQPELAAAPIAAGRAAKPAYQMLPHARLGGIAGFLELLDDHGGSDELYHIADELRMEVDDLLPILEATTMLGFSKSDKGDVEITPEGRAFAEADMATQRKLFREAVLTHIPLLQQMHQALVNKSDHSMALEFFHDILDEHFAAEEVERQMETVLNWGRSSDIFTYNSETGRLTLDQPAAPVAAGEGGSGI